MASFIPYNDEWSGAGPSHLMEAKLYVPPELLVEGGGEGGRIEEGERSNRMIM